MTATKDTLNIKIKLKNLNDRIHTFTIIDKFSKIEEIKKVLSIDFDIRWRFSLEYKEQILDDNKNASFYEICNGDELIIKKFPENDMFLDVFELVFSSISETSEEKTQKNFEKNFNQIMRLLFDGDVLSSFTLEQVSSDSIDEEKIKN